MSKDSEKEKIRNEIEYGILREDDLDDLAVLINSMREEPKDQFQYRSFSKDYYYWMYFKNPSGRAIVYTAKYRGKLVASFAMSPKRIKIGSKEMICGKTMDMFTDPGFQGLGIMSVLIKKVFQAAKDAGINIWYVTPSDKSYPIFRYKMKHEEPFQVVYSIRLLKISPLIKKYIKLPFIHKIISFPVDLILKLTMQDESKNANSIIKESSFDDEINELWMRTQYHKLSVVRNLEYMNWRYVENPDKYILFKLYQNNSIKGYIVLKITLRRGIKIGEIVDYLYPLDDDYILRILIKHSIKYFYKNDCMIAQGWVIENTALEKIFRRIGFKIKRKGVNFLLSPNSQEHLFYDRDAWLLTQGDGNDI